MKSLTESEKRRVVRRVIRRLLALLMPMYVVTYIDRINIGFAQLDMGEHLGITAAGYGVAAGLFFIGYCFFEIPSNMLAERFGSRQWLTRILLTWGTLTVLTGFVADLFQLNVLRFLVGAAEAGFLPVIMLYLRRWIPSRYMVKVMSWLFVTNPLAFLVGGLVGGLIIDHADWFGLNPWQWVFIITGVPSVIFGFITWKLLPDAPRKVSWLSTRETDWLESELASEDAVEAEPGLKAQLAALRHVRVLYLGLAFLTFAIGQYGLNLFVPLILRQFNPDYSATNIGFAASIPYAVAAIALIVLPQWANASRRNFVTLACLPFFMVGGLIGVMRLQNEPLPALIALTVAVTASFTIIPLYWAMASTSLNRTLAVVGVAMINSLANLGGFIGPYLVGQDTSGEQVTTGLIGPLLSCIVCGVLIILWPIVRRRTEQRSATAPLLTSSRQGELS
ncbi:MFS transporter [Streptomyces sp. NPDC005549]|uniref:MFS transporter n=1 Tax=Streptomyces sp. NPDC005549 TaxID=3154888 RepID=UPI0033BAA5B0